MSGSKFQFPDRLMGFNLLAYGKWFAQSTCKSWHCGHFHPHRQKGKWSWDVLSTFAISAWKPLAQRYEQKLRDDLERQAKQEEAAWALKDFCQWRLCLDGTWNPGISVVLPQQNLIYRYGFARPSRWKALLLYHLFFCSPQPFSCTSIDRGSPPLNNQFSDDKSSFQHFSNIIYMYIYFDM